MIILSDDDDVISCNLFPYYWYSLLLVSFLIAYSAIFASTVYM